MHLYTFNVLAYNITTVGCDPQQLGDGTHELSSHNMTCGAPLHSMGIYQVVLLATLPLTLDLPPSTLALAVALSSLFELVSSMEAGMEHGYGMSDIALAMASCDQVQVLSIFAGK